MAFALSRAASSDWMIASPVPLVRILFPVSLLSLVAAAHAAPGPATVLAHPSSEVAAIGGTGAFGASIGGTPPLTYRWMRDGVDVPGRSGVAMNDNASVSLTVANAALVDAGRYTVEVANALGTATSREAIFQVAPPSSAPRLTNFSIRSFAGSGADTLIVGFALAGGINNQRLLERAIGPGLAVFGVTGALADPQLDLYRGNVLLRSVDNWGGDPTLTFVGNRVGAFPLTDATSRDAATLFALSSGSYTAQVSGVGGTTGIALVEIYDSTDSFTDLSTRLTNLSARTRVGSGSDVLIVGFTIAGSSNRLLIRGIGPSLAAFGVSGFIADPQIEIYQGSTRVAVNDDWEGSEAVRTASLLLNAFALPAASKDAAVVVSLQPGSYTAVVRATNGAAGVALVEVYQLPNYPVD
jgi:hypothetical protein